MYFNELANIFTKDGMQFRSYINDHPNGLVIAKPRYILRDKIDFPFFQKRNINGQEFNRFDYWAASGEQLKEFLIKFREAYPAYIYDCPLHKRWFFVVPKKNIKEVPDQKEGAKKIINANYEELDIYMKRVQELLILLKESGVKNFGVSNSTLLGTYTYGKSDIDIIIYGKENYWKVREHLISVKHKYLKWRNVEDWKKYYATYHDGLNLTENEFIKQSQRKKVDGFFDGNVFSLFCVEEPNEISIKWGSEEYTPIETVTVKAKVVNDYNCVSRFGFWEVENSKIIKGKKDYKISKVVSMSRDFVLQAFKGETILVNGVLEKVEPVDGYDPYYRVTVGYFDSYIDRRKEEFVKVENFS